MAARSILLVAIVGDARMRAMLARALAGIGIRACGHAAGMIRPPDLLLLDDGDGDAWDWIEAQWCAGRWRRVLVVEIEIDTGVAERIAALPGDWEAAA